MKTFTFKFDPQASLKGMFDDLKKVIKTGEASIEEDSMTATSIEAILATMTKAKLDLFYCVAKQKPSSLYQLAQFLERDQSNVLRDARALEAMGIIELKEVQESGRDKLQPIALYDRIIFDFGPAVARSKAPSRKVRSKKIVS